MKLYKVLYIIFILLSVVRFVNFLFEMTVFSAISVVIAVGLAYYCRKKYLELKNNNEN